MLATALIVFREVFEAALVVGIVLAATQGVAQRARWIWAGIASGVLGSGLLAMFAGTISSAAQGMGEELLNASVLIVAVAMLGWHNIWMSRHGRELADKMNQVGHEVAAGGRPMYALAIVVGLAMLREGSEIVLFLWGIAATDNSPVLNMLAGGVLGLLGGCLVGLALYLGLLRIPQRHIFSVTSWMIVLLAAGMAAQAMGFLTQIDAVPTLGQAWWDTSGFIADRSPAGQVLHTLIGYTSRPAGIQVVAFGVTLAAILLLMRFIGTPKTPPASVALMVLLAGFAYLYPEHVALASKKVFQPLIVAGEGEIELRGHDNTYKDKTTDGQSTLELGWGVNDHWFTELEVEWEKERGKDETELSAFAWENIFAGDQGAHWLDYGLFAELEKGNIDEEPHYSANVGPILQKQWGHTLHTVNLFLHAENGGPANPNTNLLYGWQSRWLMSLALQPGFEIFGEPGDVTHFKPYSEQLLQAGPVVFGKFVLPHRFAVRYELGMLFGQTKASPDQTTKWMVEVEHVF
jgi:high-affinity iron transporter